MSLQRHLLVVGSLNADLSVRVDRLPAPGATVSGSDVTMTTGGKGANQAVAASRLGALVRMVGLVGSDDLGSEVRRTLGNEGVDVERVGLAPDCPTGTALITVDAHGENTIVISAGANRMLTPEVLPDPTELVAEVDAVLLQLEIPVATCRVVAVAARAAGRLVVLNAAPPVLPDQELRALLAEVDVLVVNETEALTLLAGVAGAPRQPRDDTPASWLPLSGHLRRLGPPTVVVTLGEGGAVAVAEGEPVHVPAFWVDTVDTVGAGDAFCAELVLALVDGEPLPEAVLRACAAVGLATTRPGAQGGLPVRAEVDALLAQ